MDNEKMGSRMYEVVCDNPTNPHFTARSNNLDELTKMVQVHIKTVHGQDVSPSEAHKQIHEAKATSPRM